jgi:carbonic anhydrase
LIIERLQASAVLPEASTRTIARVRSSPFIPHKENARGFVYDVETGRLRGVSG